MYDGDVTAYLVPKRGMGMCAYEISFAYHRKGKLDKRLGSAIARLRHARGSLLVIAGSEDRHKTVTEYLRAVKLGENTVVLLPGLWPVEHPPWLLPVKRVLPKDVIDLLLRIRSTDTLDGVLADRIDSVLSGSTADG
jgi:hypothetical protein